MTNPEVLSATNILHRRAALVWMAGEDDYQFRKFSLPQNIDYLNQGIIGGLWGNQFDNYPHKAARYQRGAHWLHMMQYAGKTAATARALYVVVQAVHEGIEDITELSQGSLAELAHAFESPVFAKGMYQGVDDVYDAPLGKELEGLDKALKQNDTELTVHAARRVMLEGAQYFVDKIAVAHSAMETLTLPEPGVSSGNIYQWTDFTG